MPTYEYECAKCRKVFTVMQHISATSRRPACPKCHSRETHQLMSAFYAKTIKKS